MEAKCQSHDNTVTAFCRKHRVVLCINCVLKGPHKVDGECCDICTLGEIVNEDEKSYIELLGLDSALREEINLLETEEKKVDAIENELQQQVVKQSEEIIKLIQKKKEKTLEELRREINNEKHVFQNRLDKTHSYLSKVSDLLGTLDKMIEGDNDDPNSARNTKTTIREIKSEVLGQMGALATMSNPAESTRQLQFIATQLEKLNWSIIDGTLGRFEFVDGHYEDVDVNSPIPESDQNKDSPAESHAQSIKTTGASNIDLKRNYQGECGNILQSFSNQVYDMNKDPDNLSADNNQSSGNGKMSMPISAPAEIKSKTIHIICTEASSKSPCVVSKLENVVDRGFVILDSTHNSVMLVEKSGTVTDSVGDKIKHGVVIDMCLFRKDELALFYESDGILQISTFEIGKKVFKHRKAISVANAVSIEELPCTGFEMDPKSQTYLISFPDRVITIHKGRNALHRRGRVTLGDLSRITTHFDPRDKSFYTMNKTLKTLECYNFEKDTILWTISQSQLPSHNFVPTTMRQGNPETLGFISSRQFFVVTKKTGSAVPTAITLSSDVDAFCLKGKGIVTAETTVEEYQDKPSKASIKLTEYS